MSNMKMKRRTCLSCEGPFTSSRPYKKYCSARCRRHIIHLKKKGLIDVFDKRVPIKCTNCHKDFKPSSPKTRYCSTKCRNQYNNSQSYQNNYEARKTYARTRNDTSDYNKQYSKRKHRDGRAVYDKVRSRCNSERTPEYKRYGARGIKVRLSLKEFLELFWHTDTCQVCNKQLQDECRVEPNGRQVHRINRDSHYSKENLVIICGECHHAITGLEKALYRTTSSGVSFHTLLQYTSYGHDILQQLPPEKMADNSNAQHNHSQ